MATLQLSAPRRHHSGAAARCVSSSNYRVSQRPRGRILINVFLAREISQNSGGLTFVREISVLQGNATSRKQVGAGNSGHPQQESNPRSRLVTPRDSKDSFSPNVMAA